MVFQVEAGLQQQHPTGQTLAIQYVSDLLVTRYRPILMCHDRTAARLVRVVSVVLVQAVVSAVVLVQAVLAQVVALVEEDSVSYLYYKRIKRKVYEY